MGNYYKKPYTVSQVEEKIAENDAYFKHFTPAHHLYRKKQQAQAFWVRIRVQMEETNQKVIWA